jgi:hypothetical protein
VSGSRGGVGFGLGERRRVREPAFMGGRRARQPLSVLGGGGMEGGKTDLFRLPFLPCFLCRVSSGFPFFCLWDLGFWVGEFSIWQTCFHDNRSYRLWNTGTFGVSPTKRSLFSAASICYQVCQTARIAGCPEKVAVPDQATSGVP